MEQPNKLHPAIAALVVIFLVSISTAAVALLNSNDANHPQELASTPTLNSSSSSNNTTTSPTNTLKDGEYTADATYATPGGNESVGVTLTLKDGIIADINLMQHATGGETAEYQSRFASGYKQLVVGKKINTVTLSRVAGSSLTSNGFNDALEQIQKDAAS
jgi:uncharacterized protein with FMN-binding domain